MQTLNVRTDGQNIDFYPKNVYEEILQNVRMILTTPKYTVPLDRNFGLSAVMLDAPVPAMQAKLTAEIIEAIHRYEPRVSVQRVTYEGDAADGLVYPKVQVKVRES